MGDDSDDESGIIGVIASFYWPLLTVVFLAWSFIGNSWGISWIIWPIGSLLFSAIAAGTVAITKYRKAQQRIRRRTSWLRWTAQRSDPAR